MRNDASYKIVGVGTINEKMFDDIIKILGDVWYVLDLKRSFISLSALNAKRFICTCEGEVLRICRAILIVMMEQRESANLYTL